MISVMENDFTRVVLGVLGSISILLFSLLLLLRQLPELFAAWRAAERAFRDLGKEVDDDGEERR